MKNSPPQQKRRLVELHEREAALIAALRFKFTFGEVVIVMRDGVPQFVKSAWVNDQLDSIVDKSLEPVADTM